MAVAPGKADVQQGSDRAARRCRRSDFTRFYTRSAFVAWIACAADVLKVGRATSHRLILRHGMKWPDEGIPGFKLGIIAKASS